MAQIATIGGSSTSTVGGSWTEVGGAASVTLNDGSDATYIYSATAPTSNMVTYPLSSVSDPLVDTGHTLYFRYAKSAAGGAQIDLTVGLKEVISGVDYLRSSTTLTNISDSWVTGSHTLTTTEAATITNYGNLRVFFEANQV